MASYADDSSPDLSDLDYIINLINFTDKVNDNVSGSDPNKIMENDKFDVPQKNMENVPQENDDETIQDNKEIALNAQNHPKKFTYFI
ncbi:hypothetical protein Glove_208g120 [Diversispora epigaea]|uniref:Uncharacterized protein n=1 Tax=Diversispora epigaea TaxID=1348612 RepID=A0A397IM25_9GLOM|nr:hypothetical protein Glove_208g120 [Diversispora epigaea]